MILFFGSDVILEDVLDSLLDPIVLELLEVCKLDSLLELLDGPELTFDATQAVVVKKTVTANNVNIPFFIIPSTISHIAFYFMTYYITIFSYC